MKMAEAAGRADTTVLSLMPSSPNSWKNPQSHHRPQMWRMKLGMLTGQGADQHQGIGARAYERNKTLFDNAAKDGGKDCLISPLAEARATKSGENFARLVSTRPRTINWRTAL